MSLTILKPTLDLETFRTLRATTDWGVPEAAVAQSAINSSFYLATLWREDVAIGMIRILGDGALNVYVQDLIVHPDHRGLGLGRDLMTAALHHLAQTCPPDISVGLMSAAGIDGFYEQLGFRARPNATEGAGFQASLAELLSKGAGND
jgi:ribosomal protein S18 acetylase RimI-like enzyme